MVGSCPAPTRPRTCKDSGHADHRERPAATRGPHGRSGCPRDFTWGASRRRVGQATATVRRGPGQWTLGAVWRDLVSFLPSFQGTGACLLPDGAPVLCRLCSRAAPHCPTPCGSCHSVLTGMETEEPAYEGAELWEGWEVVSGPAGGGGAVRVPSEGAEVENEHVWPCHLFPRVPGQPCPQPPPAPSPAQGPSPQERHLTPG